MKWRGAKRIIAEEDVPFVGSGEFISRFFGPVECGGVAQNIIGMG
jgi:hypothetical protein